MEVGMTLFCFYLFIGVAWSTLMAMALMLQPASRFYGVKRFVYPVYMRMGGSIPFMEEVLSDEMELPAAASHMLIYACAWPFTFGWSLVWAIIHAATKRAFV